MSEREPEQGLQEVPAGMLLSDLRSVASETIIDLTSQMRVS